jgi:hypothetical protein
MTDQKKADALYALAEEALRIKNGVPMSEELHEDLWKIHKRYLKRAKKLAPGRSCKKCGAPPGATVAEHKPSCGRRLHAELASTGWYG